VLGLRDLPVLEAMAGAAYRWLWGEALASNAGRFAVLLVAGWLALQLTHSPLGPGAVSCLVFAPALLIGPLAGVLADRIDRRRLIQAGAAIGAAACFFAAAAGRAHPLSFAVVLILAAAAGVAQTLEQPARMSLVPALVARPQLLNAFSLMRVPSQGAEFVGPALATGLLTADGPGAALWLCGLFYVLAVVQTGRIALPPNGRPRGAWARSDGGVWAGIREGLAYIRAERMVGILILFVGCHCAFTMAFMGVLPSFADTVLGGGMATYGLLMTAVGLGAVAGPVTLAAWARRANERRVLVATGWLSGVTLVMLGAAHTLVTATAAALAAGASQALFMVVIYSQTQALAAEGLRGRVAGLTFFFTSGVMGLFNLAMSAVAARVGPQNVLIGCGLAFVVVTAAVLVRVPELRWSISPALEEGAVP
jgi:MFS family permease